MIDALHRVAVTVRPSDLEQARAVFVELAPGGFEEVDLAREIELAAYVADPTEIVGVFPDARVEEVVPGWEDGWRAFHRPVTAGGLWLGPPWEPPPEAASAVVIDPGLAFGTGAHPTTRLCVELLARCEPGSLLDVGCGSGVLSIAAARLGYGPIVAVDDDPVAVETTVANAHVNGVVLEVLVLDALADPLPDVDVAVANVLLSPVEAILGRLRSSAAITSGYLEGQRPRHPMWSHVETIQLDGWAADRFQRETV